MQFTQSLLLGAAVSLSFLSLAFACHGKLIASGITNEEKQVILQEHNRLRQVVATGRYPGQPGAENMREIVWDDELAARAQQWADNCQFRHDPHRTINRFTMGQNLAIIWSTAPLEADDGDFPSRIQSWFNEVQKYSFGDAWSPKTGHYSQLVWGETSLVGCGFAEYKDASKYNKLYVCNYGPGGNVVGYNPYEVGKPSCSTYGMRPSSRYNGLCAAPSAGAAANSLSSNTIETYEYNSNNNLPSNNYQNNKPTNTFNTQTQNAFAQTATNKRSHTYSPSYPQQASSVSLSSGTSTGSGSNSNSKGASATSNGGSSFGTSSRGGSTAYTTEASQYKYKNKYEAYKPSASEFEKSVHKHTILRTYIEQRATEQQQQQGEDASTTPKTTKRGWSLLSWRG